MQTIFREIPDEGEKAARMQADARYDVADDDGACLPDLTFLKEEVRAQPGPPTVPKIFVSNDCSFNCAYCGCRSGRDCPRYVGEPRELAAIAVRQAKENTRGVFITSSVYKNADATEERIVETLRIMRQDLGYRGYIHAKIMPGTDPALIHQAGLYANRLSVNIEVARSEGFAKIARNKTRDNILKPMGQISAQIRRAREEAGRFRPAFATSQTTQLMAGSTGEDDKTILTLSQALYKTYGLSRVYYTAFQYRHPAAGYADLPPVSTPLWRMRRLYQADRLMQVYGFTAEEIAPDDAPNLEEDLDPKAAWALRHLDRFPVEVNTADYEALLTIPGIGVVYANRILKARKYCTVTHDVLRALGVSLKRSGSFLTCKGRFQGQGGADKLRRLLADPPEADPARLMRETVAF